MIARRGKRILNKAFTFAGNIFVRRNKIPLTPGWG